MEYREQFECVTEEELVEAASIFGVLDQIIEEGKVCVTEMREELLEGECCVCGKPSEGDDYCECICPNCGEKCFDDVTISDHGKCIDCFYSGM